MPSSEVNRYQSGFFQASFVNWSSFLWI